MLLLGLDIGTSSVKASVVDAATGRLLAAASYPEAESDILVLHPGWAEQSPDQWWEDVKQAILKCHASGKYNAHDIKAIGIAYQMHGLVLVDKEQHVLRNAIIWCDSRAVDIGNKAFEAIGPEKSLSHLLNSPGNFTASKLAWVKENEPAFYQKINKAMLPGDFIAMKMTGEITTTVPALSEGVLWDFKENKISADVTGYFGFDTSLFPDIKPLFAPHGCLKDTVATRLSLKAGIPVTYKAGDQPNNALSLNVLRPGEVAATAGTSGVIYAVTDQLASDPGSRINSFAHVNHQAADPRIGVLLNINGCGIMNRWIKDKAGAALSYPQMNTAAAAVKPGCEGLLTLPFGNGAERMLYNKMVGAHLQNLDLNVHTAAHLYRSVQEGIAFAFRYGFDIMRENGIQPAVIRAGRANLFLSDVFAQAFADVNNVALEFYEGDGSYGAAIGAGIGAGIYNDAEAMQERKPVAAIQPANAAKYNELYEVWKKTLLDKLQ
ncbi:MAG TPA: FGGY family carbohydrate kinase [Chitinophagaceae bacterium]|nr:FGGY family carbohydrate kinase [Chitinophagaceae bacterium]